MAHSRSFSRDPPWAAGHDWATTGRGAFCGSRMVQRFGDVGFGLEVGETGMAEYDPRTSPFGWHIIKRIE